MVRPAQLFLLLPLIFALTGCGLAGNELLSPFIGESSAAQTAPPGDAMTDLELLMSKEVLEFTNNERAAVGAASLAWSDEAAQVAYLHCADMRNRGYVAHVTPEGLTPADRLWNAGVAYWISGENIHYRSPPGGSAAAVQAWMASEGHRENLLDARFTHIGVGMHNDGETSWWVQVLFAP